jgi:hypothetical protein
MLRLLWPVAALLVFLVPLLPALCKGGTNMHEFASARAGIPSFTLPPASQTLAGCGRGRYRDPRTHKCRGPADIGY